MKPVLRARCCAVGLFLAGACTATVRAGAMLSPVAVTETDLGTNDAQTPLVSMINQSGIDKPFTSGVTDFEAYFTTGPQPFAQAGPGEWWSSVDFSLPVEGHLDFDLGAVYTIDRMAIWNRTLENIQVHVSQTQAGPFTLAGGSTLDNQASFFFSYLPDVLQLSTAHQARYLRLEVNSAYPFDTFDTFAYAIVGEVVVGVAGGATTLAADFDDDGDVDGDDLAEWRGAIGVTDAGDADADGDSDGEDFLIWQRELGMTGSIPAAARVPEPATSAILIAGMALLKRRRPGG